jgi:hypothetical protein
MPLLDQTRAEKLIQLARDRFDPDLSEAELKVLRDSASSADPDLPEADAPRPEIRPDFVRWLATDPEAALHIDPKGLRVVGVTLLGDLNLMQCCIAVPLFFYRCVLKGDINFLSSESRGIYIVDSSVEGAFIADRVKAHGPIFLRRTRFCGQVLLRGAQIKDDLDCAGAKMEVKEGYALSADRSKIDGSVFLREGFASSGEIRLIGAQINGDLDCSGAKMDVKGGDALSADGAKIGGNVFLREGFTSSGTIRLLGTRIKIGLDCSGAKMEVKEGDALSADGAEIGGDVFLRDGFESSGTIRFPGARIGGQLAYYGAKVAEVNCSNLRLSGDLLWIGIRKSEKTSLNLMGAVVKNLSEDKVSWPETGNLSLNGLVYEEISLYERPSDEEIKKGFLSEQLKLNVMERIRWLMLQPEEERIEPQPWMQLTRLLEAKGNRKGAKHVIFKYRALLAHAQNKLWVLRWLEIASAWIEEAPILRICWSIALSLIVGTFIFAGASRSGAMLESVQIQPNAAVLPNRESKPASIHYPPFQPFVYTLENAVPLVKLGMDERWMPDQRHVPQPWFQQVLWLDWLKWFNSYGFLMVSRWGLIVWGWVQATILAVSVADRFKK